MPFPSGFRVFIDKVLLGVVVLESFGFDVDPATGTLKERPLLLYGQLQDAGYRIQDGLASRILDCASSQLAKSKLAEEQAKELADEVSLAITKRLLEIEKGFEFTEFSKEEFIRVFFIH